MLKFLFKTQRKVLFLSNLFARGKAGTGASCLRGFAKPQQKVLLKKKKEPGKRGEAGPQIPRKRLAKRGGIISRGEEGNREDVLCLWARERIENGTFLNFVNKSAKRGVRSGAEPHEGTDAPV